MKGKQLATGLLVVSVVARLAAQTEPPELLTTLEPTAMTVGDRVTLVVTVDHAADVRVVWPESFELDPFELIDMRLLEPVPQGNRVRSSAELAATAFALGELTLPAFEVVVVDAAGNEVTLSTETAVVTVGSVGLDDGGEIRDIKGPLAIPFGVMTLLPWLAGLAAVGAAASWLYRRYRRRQRPEISAPAVPPRPAHEVAYESLAALEASGLLELGEVKTYHIRVSDIMRVYVEGRFGVEAIEMTTPEVLEGLRRASLERGVVTDCRLLLDRCDLVKFAKLRPDLPACRDLIPRGRRLVDLTKPANPILAEPAEAVA